MNHVHAALELSPFASPMQPCGADAGALAGDVQAALRERDGCALSLALVRAARELPPAVQFDSGWIPAVIGIEECRRSARPFPHAEAVLKFIRVRSRSALGRFPVAVPGVWLMPAVPRDVTAVHLAVWMLARAGKPARPWLWSEIPRSGRFMIVGTIDDPCVAHDDRLRECLGTTTLRSLQQRQREQGDQQSRNAFASLVA